jgi:carboxypeptidase family protein
MKRMAMCFLGALLIAAFVSLPIWAQGTAQISGTITDPSGAVLPGVEVTFTQTDTGVVRSTVSNETGAYLLQNVPIGPYRLDVTLPGFQSFVQNGNLSVNDNAVFNVSLKIGQAAQTVEVQADTALVETRAVGVGQLIESERIVDLPLNGRNVTQLVILSGAAVSTGVSSSRSMPGQQQISIAGSQQGAVAYVMDGAPHNNWFDNLALPLPFPDALQEFKVESSALQATQGLRSGGNVNAVTRSGTNEFHGNAFWFVRNDLFGARPYGAQNASSLKRNQFGGTIGGPIVRKRLFFFAGFQGETDRSDALTNQVFIPSPHAVSTGDWSRMLAPACGLSTRSLLATAPDGRATGFTGGNQINPALYDPVALNIVKKWLPTDRADDCGRVQFGNVVQDNDWQAVGRVDWQASNAHSVMGRLLLTSAQRGNPFQITGNVLNSAFAGFDNLAQSHTLGDTWLIDPKTVLSSRLAVNYVDVQRSAANFFDWAGIGVKNSYPYVPNFAVLTITSGFTLGGCTVGPASTRTFSASLNSDLSKLQGDHQFGIGGYINRLDSNGHTNCFSAGTFNFDGAQTGLGLADFMIGRSQQFSQAVPSTALSKKWVGALYFADTWRLKRTLTMSYGVRWEPDYPETITNDRILQFSRKKFDAGQVSTVFVNSPAGFTFVGDPDFPGKSGRETHPWKFSPRLGFAWDVFGNGRTSIRSSAGFGYDYPDAQFHLYTSSDPPFGGNATLLGAQMSDPWANYPGGNPFPLDTTNRNLKFPIFSSISQAMDASVQASQTQNWNLALQQQVGEDWRVSATYMGSHTIQMVDAGPGNPAIFFPGSADASGVCTATVSGGGGIQVSVPAGTYRLTGLSPGATCSTNQNVNQRRILFLTNPTYGQYVGDMSITYSGANASYNGVLLSLERRAAKGVTINTNYTWSHCISPFHDSGLGGSGFSSADVYQDFTNRNRSRGNCTQDRRHNVVFTSVARTPMFASPGLRAIASNWSLSGIYQINSGSYMTIVNGVSDQARNGVNPTNQFADYLGGKTMTGAAGPDSQYLNPSAFGVPALGSLGNLGARNVKGPAQWSFDVSLARQFGLGEREKLEFRAEAYNVTNSFRPTNPVSGVGLRFFGVTRGINSLDPRILQFVLKLIF